MGRLIEMTSRDDRTLLYTVSIYDLGTEELVVSMTYDPRERTRRRRLRR